MRSTHHIDGLVQDGCITIRNEDTAFLQLDIDIEPTTLLFHHIAYVYKGNMDTKVTVMFSHQVMHTLAHQPRALTDMIPKVIIHPIV